MIRKIGMMTGMVLILWFLVGCPHQEEQPWEIIKHTHMIEVDGKLYTIEIAVSQGLISLEDAVLGIDHFTIKKNDLPWIIGALDQDETTIYYIIAEIGPYRVYFHDSYQTNQALHVVYEDENAFYGYYDIPNDWPYHIFEKDGKFYDIKEVLEQGWIDIDTLREVICLFKHDK
jgi:hypothetical protein